MLLQDQCQAEDQRIWLTTDRALGFPTVPDEGELESIQDIQLGRPTCRCLHPAISAFFLTLQKDMSTQNRAPSSEEIRAIDLEKEWVTQDTRTDDPDQDTEPKEDIAWEPNPLPLMVKHPPTITASNTKIS
jgi:hypothetical protein